MASGFGYDCLFLLLYHKNKINHLQKGPYSPCSLRFSARAAMYNARLKARGKIASHCFVFFFFFYFFFFFTYQLNFIDAKTNVSSV